MLTAELYSTNKVLQSQYRFKVSKVGKTFYLLKPTNCIHIVIFEELVELGHLHKG